MEKRKIRSVMPKINEKIKGWKAYRFFRYMDGFPVELFDAKDVGLLVGTVGEVVGSFDGDAVGMADGEFVDDVGPNVQLFHQEVCYCRQPPSRPRKSCKNFEYLTPQSFHFKQR